MNKQSKTMRLTLMGLFAAVLLLMAYTPLGYLNIGPLAITLNVIPVALAAITLGPVGGAAMGAVFGLTSFLQCIGCMITGFCSAFFNTAFFMSLLVLLFGNTSYVQGLMGGKNAILFICSFVGVNAVFEMCASTFLTGAVGLALIKAKVIPVYQKAESAA